MLENPVRMVLVNEIYLVQGTKQRLGSIHTVRSSEYVRSFYCGMRIVAKISASELFNLILKIDLSKKRTCSLIGVLSPKTAYPPKRPAINVSVDRGFPPFILLCIINSNL